ncbi:MAG: CotH kinase family protein [Clostridia bacterium]|nr:CotH kinase family protein [Clostridia bacterium]
MKKYLKAYAIFINVLLLCVMAVVDVFYCVYPQLYSCKWIGGVCALLTAVVSFVFLIVKNKNQKFYPIFLLVAMLFVLFADRFYFSSSVWGIVLFCVANIMLFVSFCFVQKFNLTDLIYGAIIAIPAILFVNIAPVLGFANGGIQFVVNLLVIFVCFIIGKTVSNFVDKKDPTNVLNLIGSIFLFISLFSALCYEFSYISHYVLIPYAAFLHISLCLFAFSIITILKKEEFTEEVKTKSKKDVKTKEEEQEKCSFKNSFCKHIKTLLTVLMLSLFCGYSGALTFQNLNVANPKVSAEQFYEITEGKLNVPVIEINTQNKEAPFSKEDYVNASFKISNCKNPDHNFAVSMKANYDDEDSVGIRLRGNSTMYLRKRPFRIKFENKQKLLGLDKNKSWVLLADYLDQSYIRNYTAFAIADEFDNLQFTPTPNHVALILNGNFQGLYLLCEQIDENSGRTAVEEDFDVTTDKEFPFLVEMDAAAYKEGITGIDNFNVEGFKYVEIKYPESDERNLLNGEDVVFDYINEYINAVFKTLKTGESVEVSFRENPVAFSDLVDVNSAIDYYLMYEIMYSVDQNNLKSVYFHKTKDGKLNFGPIWDFDWSLANGWTLPYDQSYIETANNILTARSPIFSILFKDRQFYENVAARFDVVKARILEVAENLKTYKETIDAVAKLDAKCWHGSNGQFEYDMQYDYVRLYLQDRYNYLDKVFDLSFEDFSELI